MIGFFDFHTVPPGPPFPEEIHLRKVCGVVWCVDGTDEEAERAMQPLLSVAEPLMHGVGRMPLPALNSAFDGLYAPGRPVVLARRLREGDPDEAIAAQPGVERPHADVQVGSHLYPVDGAVHDVPAEDTAFAYRDAIWSPVFVGVDPDPAGASTVRDWTIEYWEALHGYSAGGAYVTS